MGKMGKIVIPGMTNLEAGKSFVQSMQSSNMEGKAVSVSYAETESLTAEVTAGNTDRKAIIMYMDTATSQRKRISIPSWGTGGDHVQQTPEGERVPIEKCKSVVQALGTATGKQLTALEGYIIQRK